MNAHSTTHHNARFYALGALLTAVSACALLTLAAPAEARERQGSVTGSNGNTATRSVSRVQGDVSASTTGPRGKTTSREVERTATTTTATTTGPNGNSVSRDTTRNSEGSQTTITGSNGQSGTVTVAR
jgi:hypothetical protein